MTGVASVTSGAYSNLIGSVTSSKPSRMQPSDITKFATDLAGKFTKESLKKNAPELIAELMETAQKDTGFIKEGALKQEWVKQVYEGVIKTVFQDTEPDYCSILLNLANTTMPGFKQYYGEFKHIVDDKSGFTEGEIEKYATEIYNKFKGDINLGNLISVAHTIIAMVHEATETKPERIPELEKDLAKSVINKAFEGKNSPIEIIAKEALLYAIPGMITVLKNIQTGIIDLASRAKSCCKKLFSCCSCCK